MAITVINLPKPYLWFETVAGGSLAATTTYYFIGFFAGSVGSVSSYYGYSPGKASDQYSVTTDAVNKSIKMEVYQNGGGVTAYADRGDATHVIVTSNAHGLSNGDTVYLRGTANYKGKYTISSVATNTFDIVATWAGDDGASKWYTLPGNPSTSIAPGNITLFLKWDTYSMLRGDGSKFQWCNTNDPNYSNEWLPANYPNYGHPKWNVSYYYTGIANNSYSTGADSSKYVTYTTIVTDTSAHNSNTTTLFNGYGGAVTCGYIFHPEISLRKYNNSAGTTLYYTLPLGMSETESAPIIYIDNTNQNNDWSYLVTAIKASPLYNKTISLLIRQDTGIYGLEMLGLIMSASTITNEIVWYSKIINIYHGQIYIASSKLTLNGCSLFTAPISPGYWTQWAAKFTNSALNVYSGSYILDNIGTTSNFSPFSMASGLTSYVSKDGYVFSGRGDIYSNLAQLIRYPVDNAYIRNMKFYYITNSWAIYYTGTRTYELTNIAFYSPQSESVGPTSAYNRDIQIEDGITGGEVHHTFNCYNVTTNDRADKKLRVLFSNKSTPGYGANSTLIFNLFFATKFYIYDENGSVISGVDISISNSKGTPDVYTGTTDANGYLSKNVLCYTVEYDPSNADGYVSTSTAYKFYSKTTMFNDLTFTISKSGYETYEGTINDVFEDKTTNITLKTAIPQKITSDGEVLQVLEPELGSSSKLLEV